MTGPVEAGTAGPVVAVVGPTAAGKSALGIALAHALGGEVVNTDSMQLYRGMDVGTAKLTAAEREGVPHHLLDVWDVTEAASVAEYQRLARAAVDSVRAAGRVPVLVGGSGLYVRAVLDRLEFPGTDPVLRARLDAELATAGPAPLHARLGTLDPEAAAAILPSNGRRIVRALEVIELTGRPFTATLPGPEPYYEAVQLGVDLEPAALDARVDARVGAMWAAGLVEEVRELEKLGLRDGPDRVQGARLRPGVADVRRCARRRPGARADPAGHPPLRPPATLLVPPRRPGALAGRRPPRPPRRRPRPAATWLTRGRGAAPRAGCGGIVPGRARSDRTGLAWRAAPVCGRLRPDAEPREGICAR